MGMATTSRRTRTGASKRRTSASVPHVAAIFTASAPRRLSRASKRGTSAGMPRKSCAEISTLAGASAFLNAAGAKRSAVSISTSHHWQPALAAQPRISTSASRLPRN